MLKNTLTSIVLAGALALGSGGCKEEPKSLDSYLTKEPAKVVFQEEIPGASKVEEYHVPGSDETLVYIRQYHNLPMGLGHPTKKVKIYAVQDNILEVLKHLNKTGRIKSLYVEGLSEESEEKVNKLLDEIRVSGKNEDYALWLLNATAPLELQQYGSSSVFSIRSGMPLHSSETLKMNEKAVMTVNQDPNSDTVLKDREDFLLKKIDRDNLQGNGCTVFVYGAGHDFRDNIARWNAKHPNDMYSLIVVTPKGVE